MEIKSFFYTQDFFAAVFLPKKPPLQAVYVSNMAFYDYSLSDNFTDVKFLQAGLAVFAFRPSLLSLRRGSNKNIATPFSSRRGCEPHPRAKQFALFNSAANGNKKPPVRAVFNKIQQYFYKKSAIPPFINFIVD